MGLASVTSRNVASADPSALRRLAGERGSWWRARSARRRCRTRSTRSTSRTPRAISGSPTRCSRTCRRSCRSVPRPRLHLIRFHGVLAPNAKLRALVVPKVPPEQHDPATEAVPTVWREVETVQARPHRISWARLLERVFNIDMQHCPNCGAGELKIIAASTARPTAAAPGAAAPPLCSGWFGVAPRPARDSPCRCRSRPQRCCWAWRSTRCWQ